MYSVHVCWGGGGLHMGEKQEFVCLFVWLVSWFLSEATSQHRRAALL